MSLLQVSGLTKSYAGRRVVDRVGLQVGAGEVVGLLGANGAGKSTTFRMVVGLIRPDAGRIVFAGRDVVRLPMYARSRLGMGYLAQEPTVFARLSVADNVRLVLEEHCPRAQRKARLASLLEELGLSHLAGSRAGTLSGGERRRLEITRALVTEPKLMFFDEPFAGVDPKNRRDIADIVRRVRERGISVLITDHHAEAILRLVDRLYVMHEGVIQADGTPEAIVANEDVRRSYLGEDFRL